MAHRDRLLSDLPLSTRLRGVLMRMNLRTVGDLVAIQEREFSTQRNFGPKSATELRAVLKTMKLSLGCDHIEVKDANVPEDKDILDPVVRILDALDEVYPPDREEGTWMGLSRDDAREAVDNLRALWDSAQRDVKAVQYPTPDNRAKRKIRMGSAGGNLLLGWVVTDGFFADGRDIRIPLAICASREIALAVVRDVKKRRMK